MPNETKVLVVDDNNHRSHDLLVILNFLGERCVHVESKSWLDDAKKAISSDISVVFLDASLSSLADEIKAWDAGIPVIILNSDKNELVISEYKNIISEMGFPPSSSQLQDNLHRAQIFREQMRQGKDKKKEPTLFKSLVGASRSVHMVREMMGQVADKDVTVLVTGESGTGKEVIAKNLHYNSKRKNKAFVPVNCGAIPTELIESELFGHEKGAFTGAITARAGRFEMAEGGTLFLDEIGDLPLPMQVKLLRVLQERTYERVGGTKTLTANIRIVTATHRDLEKMIEDGSFREDLYYRINVFPIEMPALRERTEDVPLLLNELVNRLERENRGTVRFNSAAILSLCRHEWPGNIREMGNLVERLAIMFPQEIVGINELPKKYRHLDDLDEATRKELEFEHTLSDNSESIESRPAAHEANVMQQALLPLNGINLKEYLTELESSLITQALDDANGVVARAAEKLHIRRTTLVEKMKKLNITK